MVHCCVPGCINHSSKTCNISYHRIPNDKGLRKASWLARIRRDNLPPLQNCYVCSEHFTDDCFEVDLKARLMPELKVKRRLKRDAIPSVFSFGPEPKKPRLSTENRESRLQHKNYDKRWVSNMDLRLTFFLKLIKFPELKLSSSLLFPIFLQMALYPQSID